MHFAGAHNHQDAHDPETLLTWTLGPGLNSLLPCVIPAWQLAYRGLYQIGTTNYQG